MARTDRRTHRSLALQNSATFRPTHELWLAALATLLLAAGAAVYLFDRAPGTAMLLPVAWQRGGIGEGGAAILFGDIGGWLPSFVHTFAFGIFTALLLPRRTASAAAACAGWAVVDTLAELGQHPAIAPALAAGLEQAFGAGTLVDALGRYFVRGSFSPADVIAGLAGAGLAFVALVALRAAKAAGHAGTTGRKPGKKSSSEELS